MTNLDAIRALCTKICSGFYPDQNVLEFTLLDNDIDPSKNFIPKDVELVKAAISVVKGMTENSHSESGISDGWDADRINKSISAICREYNIDISSSRTASRRTSMAASSIPASPPTCGPGRPWSCP